MGYPSMNKTYAQAKYNVSVRSAGKSGVKYIVVHYTGTSASAKNNCIYFSTGNRSASADYFIDKDGSIYKFNANCKKYYTWHCGDGHGAYGITNANSIGIEVVSAGEKYTDKQKAALKSLVNAIQADFGISNSNIVRHYDASHKICPYAYSGSDAKNKEWIELKKYLTSSTATVAKTTIAVSTAKTTTTTAKATTSTTKLDIDGILGPASIKELQTQLKVTVNGKVAGQKKAAKSYVIVAGSNWTFNNGKGAPVIKALQKKLGTTQDGYIGPVTIKALQKFVGTSADGILGKDTAKAVQKALNNKKFA